MIRWDERVKSVTVIGQTQTEHFKLVRKLFVFGIMVYQDEKYLGQAREEEAHP